MTQPLFLMHLTKTAGGSLRRMLEASGDKVQFHYNDHPQFRPKFDYPGTPDVYFGHYAFGVHKLTGHEPRYGCILRDPIKRTVSHFHHLKAAAKGELGERVRRHDSVAEFMLAERYWEFDNFLCRIISGVQNKVRFGDVGFNIYLQALENLKQHFVYLGFFEDMDASFERLKAFVDINVSEIPKVNVGRYEPEISPDTQRVVGELMVFDQMLYEDALVLAGRLNPREAA